MGNRTQRIRHIGIQTIRDITIRDITNRDRQFVTHTIRDTYNS